MKKIKVFIITVLFLLIVLMVYRFVFLFRYADFDVMKINDLISAFLVGLRFDIATSAYILAPFSVLAFLPYLSDSKRYFTVLMTLNACWLTFIAIYLFADFLYYPFSLRHLTFEPFNVGRDLTSLIKIGLFEYSKEVFFFCILIAALVFSYLLLIRKVLKNYSFRRHSFVRGFLTNMVSLFIVTALSVTMARGGIQLKPLAYSDAFVLNSPFLGQLALNGVYTSMRTYYSFKKGKEMKGWEKRYSSKKEATLNGIEMIVDSDREENFDPKYPLFRHFKYEKTEFRPLNVVIFVMESWSRKFVGALGGEDDAVPFFSSLSEKGVLLKNYFANGQRSIDSISAILTSIPPSSGMILSQSGTLTQMPVKFLPSNLKEKGYSTFFIHGAKSGSMWFNSLTKQTGIERYISKEDMLKEGCRDDGFWGIYDEDSFLYAHRLFEVQKNPFFAVIFSLSSHTPYKLPSGRFNFYKTSKPFHDFLNSLRYSDYALSQFFEAARKSRYFDNTVFIIVGDHTEGASTRNNLLEMFRVPCLLYAPKYLKPAILSKPATHVDLVPTVLDILKSSDNHASFGQSVFNKNQGIGLLAYGDFDIFIREGWMLVSSTNGIMETYPFLEPERKEILAGLEREKGYYLQFFHDLIMDNRLHPPN